VTWVPQCFTKPFGWLHQGFTKDSKGSTRENNISWISPTLVVPHQVLIGSLFFLLQKKFNDFLLCFSQVEQYIKDINVFMTHRYSFNYLVVSLHC
jgi:hypothetical protein